MAEPLHRAGDWLGHVHIADNCRFQPGAGCLDCGIPFRALKEVAYDGFIIIECWSPEGPVIAGDPEVVLPETVAFMRTEGDRA